MEVKSIKTILSNTSQSILSIISYLQICKRMGDRLVQNYMVHNRRRINMAFDLKDKVIQGAIIISVIHLASHYVGEAIIGLTPMNSIYIATIITGATYIYLS